MSTLPPSSPPNFTKHEATEEELQQIDLLMTQLSTILHNDGSSPDLCRHVLLRMLVRNYKSNIETGITPKQMGEVMWDEYSNVMKIEFQNDFFNMMHLMVSKAIAEAKEHYKAMQNKPEDLR